ncbi:hypothetical protein COY93_01530 [Candidatus Uhrbacteria bacterium CG_4_10_14_0_8_um_filter_58_22]|uniref:Uncharacterized protein n=1 Tax=Candidatus Uhrbacteria bacterium CG_4_10_14_0_8_um_filter_58_22 TaxID=1975029 RepID=A0A2M7QBI3_9BACT|nr:MAG: hypothetical protein AUJ19_00090 [Parcubacteria group bacterium CG1_02_58_44]PIY63022.1 MAG: hypothetical protein COY93_01530 [Candidatus Uhrbacteria bacterium CG_4_10_14_0_8_um_filter_58_22]
MLILEQRMPLPEIRERLTRVTARRSRSERQSAFDREFPGLESKFRVETQVSAMMYLLDQVESEGLNRDGESADQSPVKEPESGNLQELDETSSTETRTQGREKPPSLADSFSVSDMEKKDETSSYEDKVRQVVAFKNVQVVKTNAGRLDAAKKGVEDLLSLILVERVPLPEIRRRLSLVMDETSRKKQARAYDLEFSGLESNYWVDVQIDAMEQLLDLAESQGLNRQNR